MALLIGGFTLAVAALGIVGYAVTRPPERSPAAFCAALEPVRGLDDALATDPANLDDEVDQLQAVLEASPPEIHADVATLVSAIEKLATAAAASPDDPSAGVDEAFTAMGDDQDAISAAAQDVGFYAQQNCGIALAGTAPTDTAPPGTRPPTPPTSAT